MGVFLFFGQSLETVLFAFVALYFFSYFFVYYSKMEGLSALRTPILHVRNRLSGNYGHIFLQVLRGAPYYVSSALFYVGVFGLCWAISQRLGVNFVEFFGLVILTITFIIYIFLFLLMRSQGSQIWTVFRGHVFFVSLVYFVFSLFAIFSDIHLGRLFYINSSLLIAGLLVVLFFDEFKSLFFKRNIYLLFSVYLFSFLLLIIFRSDSANKGQWLVSLFLFLGFFYYFVAPILFSLGDQKRPNPRYSHTSRLVGISNTILAQILFVIFLYLDKLGLATILAFLFIPLAFHFWLHFSFRNYIVFVVSLLTIDFTYYYLISGALPGLQYGAIVLATLFLPICFVLITYLKGWFDRLDVYIIHYAGHALMLYMTFYIIFIRHATLLEISSLLILESFIWYLSFLRTQKLAPEYEK